MSVIANLDYGAVQDILSGMVEHPKVKRGRPGPKIGSKNKKTLLKESVSTTEPKKRGRGRPVNSRNKYPSKTKKNIAAATVIQNYVRNHVIC